MSEIHDFGYRAPRFHVDFHFLMQIGGNEPRLLNARCRDISEDGLAAQLPEPLEVGTGVTLILTLPGSARTVRIAGRITNRQAEDHGCVFLFGSLGERAFVREYLASLGGTRIPMARPSGQETR